MKSRSEISQLQPICAGWSGSLRSMSGLNFGLSAFPKVTDRVHFFVGDADDINGAATKQIETHMLAFGKAMVTLADATNILTSFAEFEREIAEGAGASGLPRLQAAIQRRVHLFKLVEMVGFEPVTTCSIVIKCVKKQYVNGTFTT